MTLSLFTETEFNPDLSEVIGTSWACLGMTGSGKSTSMARLAEQSLYHNMPLAVIDIAGEYWSLQEKFGLVVVGQSTHVDIHIETPEQAAALAVWSLTERCSVVLDISGVRPKGQKLAMVNAFLTALFDKSVALRRPYMIFLEEAHNYIPQSTVTPASEIVTTIASEGRKFGLSLIMASQRPARIDKDVLSQALVRLLHAVFDPNDVAAYQGVIPESKAWVKEHAPALKPGEAILVSPQRRLCTRVRVLSRETWHGGGTPGMEDTPPPALTGLPGETLKALEEMLTAKAATAPATEDRTEELQTINALERRIAQLEAENKRLREENAWLMTQPKVSAPPPKPAPPAREPDHRSAVSLNRAIAKQQREFNQLLSLIRTIPRRHHSVMLGYLIRYHSLGWFTASQLAVKLGYSTVTLRSKPPTRFMEMGLIKRQISGERHSFTAQGIETVLKNRYPDLNVSSMLDHLIKACGV